MSSILKPAPLSFPPLGCGLGSFKEGTCFTAPCPFCETQIKVTLEINADFHPGQIEQDDFYLVSVCCPFCQTPIILLVRKWGSSTYMIDLAEPASWCRLHLTAPDGDLGKPSLPLQSSMFGSGTAASRLITLLKDNGYLAPRDISNIEGLEWTGNLYWNRSCPKCLAETQIKFAPIPVAAFSKPTILYDEAEIQNFKSFLFDCGRGTLDQCLPCPHCATLLTIQLFPLEGGGFYMAKWEDAGLSPALVPQTPSNTQFRVIPFGESGEAFNQISLAKEKKARHLP